MQLDENETPGAACAPGCHLAVPATGGQSRIPHAREQGTP